MFISIIILSKRHLSLSHWISSFSFSPPFRCLAALLLALQPFEHVDTSSQHLSHFFLHVNGLSQITHIFDGKFSFFTPLGIMVLLLFPPLVDCNLIPRASTRDDGKQLGRSLRKNTLRKDMQSSGNEAGVNSSTTSSTRPEKRMQPEKQL